MQGNASIWYPTALLVKTHNVTGKKYFCKTTKLNKLDTYTGSGLAWKSHLKQYGKDISTGVVGVYYESERCLEASLKYSKEWDIVASKEWLNLIDENGLDGAGAGVLHHMYGKPHPQKGTTTSKLKGRYVGALNPMYGKTGALHHSYGKTNLGASLAHKGRKRPEGGGKKPHAVIGTKDGITVEFNSVSDAARFINGSRSSVHKCCSGKAKTGGGYTWKYKEQ
jgi:hypothetical protein